MWWAEYRSCILRLMAGVVLASLACVAAAQLYPAKAVRIIVPYGTGSATDALARLIAQKMSDSVGQQVVVDNQPGANGIPASAAVAKAPPDGYTLIMIAANHVVNASLYSKLPYDTLKDFKPVLRVAFAPFILTVHPSLPVKNLAEFIALAKSRPGQLNYASPSNGSPAPSNSAFSRRSFKIFEMISLLSHSPVEAREMNAR